MRFCHDGRYGIDTNPVGNALTVIVSLLERMAEHACADTWRNIRDDLKGMQLAQFVWIPRGNATGRL